jgi:hypothetical protein
VAPIDTRKASFAPEDDDEEKSSYVDALGSPYAESEQGHQVDEGDESMEIDEPDCNWRSERNLHTMQQQVDHSSVLHYQYDSSHLSTSHTDALNIADSMHQSNTDHHQNSQSDQSNNQFSSSPFTSSLASLERKLLQTLKQGEEMLSASAFELLKWETEKVKGELEGLKSVVLSGPERRQSSGSGSLSARDDSVRRFDSGFGGCDSELEDTHRRDENSEFGSGRMSYTSRYRTENYGGHYEGEEEDEAHDYFGGQWQNDRYGHLHRRLSNDSSSSSYLARELTPRASPRTPKATPPRVRRQNLHLYHQHQQSDNLQYDHQPRSQAAISPNHHHSQSRRHDSASHRKRSSHQQPQSPSHVQTSRVDLDGSEKVHDLHKSLQTSYHQTQYLQTRLRHLEHQNREQQKLIKSLKSIRAATEYNHEVLHSEYSGRGWAETGAEVFAVGSGTNKRSSGIACKKVGNGNAKGDVGGKKTSVQCGAAGVVRVRGWGLGAPMP